MPILCTSVCRPGVGFEERAEGMKQSLLETGKQPSWALLGTRLWYLVVHGERGPGSPGVLP